MLGTIAHRGSITYDANAPGYNINQDEDGKSLLSAMSPAYIGQFIKGYIGASYSTYVTGEIINFTQTYTNQTITDKMIALVEGESYQNGTAVSTISYPNHYLRIDNFQATPDNLEYTVNYWCWGVSNPPQVGMQKVFTKGEFGHSIWAVWVIHP